MTGILRGLSGLMSGGLCAAFCAAVREATPTNLGNSVVRVAGAVQASYVDNLNEHVAGTSGAYPAVLAFDVDGQYIGQSDGANNQGDLLAGIVDIVVHQEELGPAKQITYLQIINDKPMCLSYVLQNMTGSTPALWTGDVGRSCGKEWFYSDARMYVPLESLLPSQPAFRVSSVWIATTLCHPSSEIVPCSIRTTFLVSHADFGTMKAEMTFRIALG